LITSTRQLWKAVYYCAKHRVVGVDTESNSFWAYQEKVCLIQLYAGDRTFLVDPLAMEDVAPLGHIFHDPGIVKIFHGADYDLRCLHRDFALHPAPIFDTMIAAQLLDYPALGLAALVKHHFGVELPKTNALTRYDWSRRPLPDEHLEYSANDVIYLPQLRENLSDELCEKDLLEETEWEFRQLEQMISRNPPKADTEDFYSIKGARQMNDKQRAVLRRLYEYRDKMARDKDVPHFKILSNTLLIGTARRCPHRMNSFKDIHKFPASLIRRHGRALLDMVKKGEDDYSRGDIPALPHRPPVRGPNVNSDLMVQLKEWRNKEAERREVAPLAVLPTSCLKDIARASHLDTMTLSQIPGMIPSRLRRYGEKLLEMHQRAHEE
jgi:ribonuclease D